MGKPLKKKLPAARAKVDDALWERICIWYVNNKNQHAKAVKEFGLSRRTLTGYYFSGAQHLNRPPIKALVETVEWKARALRASMKQEELEKAEAEIQNIINGGKHASTLAKSVDDAVAARAEEGAVVAASRRNILALQNLLAPLLLGASKRAKELEGLLAKEEVGAMDLLKLFRELGKFQSDLNSAAKVNMEMERMLMGEPQEAKAQSVKTKGEAIRVLELGARTLDRLRSKGKIVETEGVDVSAGISPLLGLQPDEDEDADEDEDEDATEAEKAVEAIEDLEPDPFPEEPPHSEAMYFEDDYDPEYDGDAP
jgi:hypothetical protein